MDQNQAYTVAKAEFRFRKDKDTGYQRPTVEVDVPYPTAAYIQEVLNRDADDKTHQLVVDTIAGVINTHLRGYVNSDAEFSQDTVAELLEKGELSLDHIANLPRSERSRITNEDLSNFGAAFVAVAKEVEGTEQHIASAAGAQVAAQAFADRLRAAAGKNEILDKLQTMLEKFANAASDEVLEDTGTVLEWLYVKIEEAKRKDELNLDNLD